MASAVLRARSLHRRLDRGRTRRLRWNAGRLTSATGGDRPMRVEHPYAVRHRTHLAGSLRAEHAGTRVRLGGWVHRRRSLGGIVFIDLRDRAGLVQVSVDPRSAAQEMIDAAAALG